MKLRSNGYTARCFFSFSLNNSFFLLNSIAIFSVSDKWRICLFIPKNNSFNCKFVSNLVGKTIQYINNKIIGVKYFSTNQ